MSSTCNIWELANPKQVFSGLPYCHGPCTESVHVTALGTPEEFQGGIIQCLILLHNQLDLLTFPATQSLLCDGRQMLPRCLQADLANTFDNLNLNSRCFNRFWHDAISFAADGREGWGGRDGGTNKEIKNREKGKRLIYRFPSPSRTCSPGTGRWLPPSAPFLGQGGRFHNWLLHPAKIPSFPLHLYPFLWSVIA